MRAGGKRTLEGLCYSLGLQCGIRPAALLGGQGVLRGEAWEGVSRYKHSEGIVEVGSPTSLFVGCHKVSSSDLLWALTRRGSFITGPDTAQPTTCQWDHAELCIKINLFSLQGDCLKDVLEQ